MILGAKKRPRPAPNEEELSITVNVAQVRRRFDTEARHPRRCFEGDSDEEDVKELLKEDVLLDLDFKALKGLTPTERLDKRFKELQAQAAQHEQYVAQWQHRPRGTLRGWGR